MDFILIAILVIILGLVITYIYKAKKSGVKCIGCVHSKTCSGHCSECQSQKSTKNIDDYITSRSKI